MFCDSRLRETRRRWSERLVASWAYF